MYYDQNSTTPYSAAYETVLMTEVELKETTLGPSDGLTALTKPSAD